MPETSLFEKIIARQIPADIVYEDEHCLAFNDIDPKAPVHILLVPKKHIDYLASADVSDQSMLGHLMLKAAEIARAKGVGDDFRLVINNGEAAGQTVFHLHIHILGGRALGWPPG